MSDLTQLVKTYGDGANPFHRSALAGNAMIFNANRWVRVTAGADPLPQLMPQNVFTVVVSCVAVDYVPFLGSYTGLVNAGFYSPSPFPPTYKNGFRCFHNAIGVFGNINSLSNETTVLTADSEPFNKKIIFINSYDGSIPSEIDRFDFIIQGRKRVNKNLLYGGSGPGVMPQQPIGIGRIHNFQAYFVGYVRSVEILLRKLSGQEARRVFNFGTAYAAGLTTSADISIDFNRINGQAPICRPGARQLTVTPMNNTTPDTAGAAYVDFYSL